MDRENWGQVACFLLLFAMPFILLVAWFGLGSDGDSPERRMWAWLACCLTYVAYPAAHVLFFGSKRQECYKPAAAFCITAASLFLFSFGMAWMCFYLQHAFIPILVLAVVFYRLLMTAWFRKPYFNEPREIGIELVHDLLVAACFAWVGIVAGSSLWVAGAGVWLVYSALNQYHSWLNLQRGYGYVSVVFSVAASCSFFVILVKLGTDPSAIRGLYVAISSAAFVMSVAFLGLYYVRVRRADARYQIPILSLVVCLVVFVVAYISADHLMTDVSLLAPVPSGSVYLGVVLAIGSFVAISTLCIFMMLQCLVLIIPEHEETPGRF